MNEKFASRVDSLVDINQFTNDLYGKNSRNKKLADGLYQFVIPEYQRQYAWNVENIDNFILSIEEIANTRSYKEKTTFFGQIIFSKNENNDLELVDGQQRLTTFTIMARLIWEEAFFQLKEDTKKFTASFIYSDTQKNDIKLQVQMVNKVVFESYVFFKFDKVSNIVGESGINLIDGFDNCESFEYFLIENRVEVRKKLASYFKKSQKFKKDNYERIVANLDQIYKDLIDGKTIREIDDIADTLQYIHNNMLIADDADDALEIFQTLNSTGKPLTDYDLIKSETISKLKIEKEWQDIHKLNLSHTEISDAINLFLKVKYSDEIKWDKKTYKAFKKVFNGKESVLDKRGFVDEMISFVELYSDIKEGKGFGTRVSSKINEICKVKKINDSFAMLMKLKYKPCLPIPFSMALKLIDNKDEKDINKLLEAINFASYAPLIKVSIFGEKPSELESIAKYWINDNSLDYKKYFRDKIIRRDFVVQCALTTKLVDEKAKIVLSLFEVNLPIDITIIRQVEHIFPKKAKQKEWSEFFETDADNYVNRLGNLVLLSDKINKDAKNYSFSVKKLKYKDETEDYIQIHEIRKLDSWNPKNIEDRSEILAKEIQEKFVDMGLLNKL